MIGLGNKFHHFLMSSYLYYIHGKSYLRDIEFDMISKELLKHWDSFKHPHKYLVTKHELETTSMHHLKENEYPNIVKNAALLYIKLKQTN